MTAAITLDGVTKRFGTVTAVDDLNLEFRQDVVTGLLGRNGAGKTVTLTGSRERVDALLPGRSVLRSTQVGAMRTVIVENKPRPRHTGEGRRPHRGGDGSPHPGGRLRTRRHGGDGMKRSPTMARIILSRRMTCWYLSPIIAFGTVAFILFF